MVTSPGDHLKPKVILIESWFGNDGVGSKEQEKSATDKVCERPENPAQSPYEAQPLPSFISFVCCIIN